MDSYQLLIKFGASSSTVAVFEKETNKFLFAESFLYDNAESDTSMVVRLQNIWNNHEYLIASFWKEVVLIPVNKQFTIVPSKLFSEEQSSDYLKLNTRVSQSKEQVFSQELPSIESTAIFTIGSELYDWFKEIYPQAEIKCAHLASSFLMGISSSIPSSSNTIYVNTSGKLMSVAVVQDGKLKFVNNFEYHRSPEDFNYFVLLVISELQLAQETVEVKVWGDISETTPQMDVLKSYVKSLSFGDRPEEFTFTVPFNEIPNHFNLDIYSATRL